MPGLKPALMIDVLSGMMQIGELSIADGYPIGN